MVDKLIKLKDRLSTCKSAVIAFSGEVDSTFPARVAKDVYWEYFLLITTALSTYPFYELEEAISLANTGFSKSEISKRSGFSNITIDLNGYRTGSMNEGLTESDKKGYKVIET